jgi:hypothetical protein
MVGQAHERSPPYSIGADGVIRSHVFPGSWLVVDDLLTVNMTQVLAILQEGLGSPEHIVFSQ